LSSIGWIFFADQCYWILSNNSSCYSFHL